MASDGTRPDRVVFDVPVGAPLPDLAALIEPAPVQVSTEQVARVYYDTAEGDLHAAEVTLWRGETGWSLDGPGVRVDLPTDGRGVPAEMQRLIRGLRGAATLRQVAREHVECLRQRAEDPAGAGELCVDVVQTRVQVLGSPDAVTVQTQRQVVATGNRAALKRLRKRLRKRLGKPVATQARAVFAPRNLPRSRDPVSTYLAAQLETLVRGDLALRSGDESAVHRVRVATRRYRSVLRVCRGVLDADRAATLDAELRWYALALGEVRDRQVMRTRLGALAERVPSGLLEPAGFGAVNAELERERTTARAALERVLAGRRYLALLADLRAGQDATPVVGAVDLAEFLARARRQAKRRLARAEQSDDVEIRHRARKAVKRLRYVAELAERELGKPARELRRRAKGVQKRLGRELDAAMTVEFLQRCAQSTDPRVAYAAGVLSVVEMTN